MRKLYLLLTLICVPLFSQEIMLGDGTDTTYASGPIGTFYSYSYYQMIYKASDINTEGTITSLKFKIDTEEDFTHADDNVDVWIGHTDKSYFTEGDDWLDINTMTQVMTNATVTRDGFSVIFSFEVPFEYNGTDNLVIAVDANEDGYDTGAGIVQFYVTRTGENYPTLFYAEDDVNPDPNIPPSYGNQLTASYPNMTIVMGGLSVTNQLRDDISIEVYPNPLKDVLNIKAKNNIKNVKVYSASGQVVYQLNDIKSNDFNVNVERWLSGSYYVNVQFDDGEQNVKIIKK